MLGRQHEGSVLRLVANPVGRCLVVEPFPHIALGQPGALGQRLRGDRLAVAHCAVQAEPVTQLDEDRGQGSSQIANDPVHELIGLRGVDGGLRAGASCMAAWRLIRPSRTSRTVQHSTWVPSG